MKSVTPFLRLESCSHSRSCTRKVGRKSWHRPVARMAAKVPRLPVVYCSIMFSYSSLISLIWLQQTTRESLVNDYSVAITSPRISFTILGFGIDQNPLFEGIVTGYSTCTLLKQISFLKLINLLRNVWEFGVVQKECALYDHTRIWFENR